MGRRRIVVGLTTLAALVALVALVALAGGATLRWVEANPTPRTALTAPAGQYISPLAIDATSGHVYVTLNGLARNEIRVLDGGGDSRGPVLTTNNGWLPPPVVAPDTGRVFALRSSPDGRTTRVHMFATRNGARLATTIVPLAPDGSIDGRDVAVRGRTLVMSSPGNQACTGSGPNSQNCTVAHAGVAILDAATGRLRRILRVPNRAWSVGIDASANRILVATSSGFGAAATIISFFDAATGRLAHRTVLNAPMLVPGRMTVDEATGRAFVLASTQFATPLPTRRRGYVFVLDTRSGALVRAIALGATPSDVAIGAATNRVFVADSGPERYYQKTVANGGIGMFLPVGAGSLHMLDARTGALLYTAALGIMPGSIAVDERRGLVYVTHAGGHDGYGTINNVPLVIKAPIAGPGGISVVDATTGRVLRTVALGVAPQSLALDDRTQQLFIGDGGDSTPGQAPDPWGWLPAQVRRRVSFLPQHVPASRPIPGRVLEINASRL